MGCPSFLISPPLLCVRGCGRQFCAAFCKYLTSSRCCALWCPGARHREAKGERLFHTCAETWLAPALVTSWRRCGRGVAGPNAAA